MVARTQEFNGFPNKMVNSSALVVPAPDGLYYDKYLDEALQIVGRYKGNSHKHGHHKSHHRRHRHDDD